MHNVSIIEYPNTYQVRVYDYDVQFLMSKYLGEIDSDKKERRKRIKEQLERQYWQEWHEVEYDFEDLDDLWAEEDKAKKDYYGLKAAARAKKNVYYLARSNIWEWFVTLTLDSDKIDRYNFDVVSKQVRKWFDNLKQRKCKDMYYLIVPEQHKDGAWHFHGLIGGCDGLEFTDSGKYCGKGSNRQKIYNFEDWKFGFSTATKVQDTERVSAYICKYITKTMAANTEGKQRYWVSQNCNRAVIKKRWFPDNELYDFKESLYDVMKYKSSVNTEWCKIDYFEIPKEDFVYES